jgi:hypothetical protein
LMDCSSFSVGCLPDQLAATGEAHARLMSENDKLYFAGVSPYFWVGRLQGGNPADLPRRYYDYNGGEGVATQWNSVINVQKPPMVEIVTWNDFTESYLSPADPEQVPLKQYFYNAGPLIKSHTGYTELGGEQKTFSVSAGLSHTRVPFNTGEQMFDLVRDGQTIIHRVGVPIDATITAYNFTTTSGFGYAP